MVEKARDEIIAELKVAEAEEGRQGLVAEFEKGNLFVAPKFVAPKKEEEKSKKRGH